MTHIQRRLISVVLVAIVFVLFGGLADRVVTYLQHSGFRSVPIMAFLGVAVLVTYVAFTAILHFASATQRAVVVFGSAAIITAIWLAFVLARSTITESG